MRRKPALSHFGYLTFAFVGYFGFVTSTASTATAGPILGHLDASVVEVPFNPGGGIATPEPAPTLDVGVPTLSDHVFTVEIPIGPGGDGGKNLDLEEVYQFYGDGGRGYPTPARFNTGAPRASANANTAPWEERDVIYD